MLKEMWRELPMWSKIGLLCSFTIFALTVGACNMKFWKGYPQDNVIENYVEDVINNELEWKIDLSPNSAEDENRWKEK